MFLSIFLEGVSPEVAGRVSQILMVAVKRGRGFCFLTLATTLFEFPRFAAEGVSTSSWSGSNLAEGLTNCIILFEAAVFS